MPIMTWRVTCLKCKETETVQSIVEDRIMLRGDQIKGFIDAHRHDCNSKDAPWFRIESVGPL